MSLISMAMERKVWTRTKGSDLFPNLYVILVATPGIGKSEVLKICERTLRQVPNIHVAPSSLTTASMIDTIALSKRQLSNPGPTFGMEFNSLQVVASELGVFLPAYDPAFMNTLTKLYDGEHYEERRRTGKVNHIKIEKPLLAVLGGTTPSYLNSFLPEGGWEQGFTSRTIFIFSDELKKSDPFIERDNEDEMAQLYTDLVHDLKLISQLAGKMAWTQPAMDALSHWYQQDDLKPVPSHGKLTHYNSRRLAHTIKLCIIASVARSSNMEISLADFFTAKTWLLDAELRMDNIFNVSRGGDSSAISDCKDFISRLRTRQGHPVSEHLVVAFLRDRVPTRDISKIIEMMVRAHDLKCTIIAGVPCYEPSE